MHITLEVLLVIRRLLELLLYVDLHFGNPPPNPTQHIGYIVASHGMSQPTGSVDMLVLEFLERNSFIR